MSLINTSEFATLAAVHFLAVVAPGPDFVITVRQSVRYGRVVGVVTALGIGAGISLHVGYTLLGIATLLHTYMWLSKAVSVIGAIYLCYLGITLLRSRPQSTVKIGARAEAASVEPTLRTSFLLGFLTNATNPKATLFFLAIFTTLVESTTPLKVQVLYGTWMCMVNAVWFMLVACLFTIERVRTSFLRFGHWLERFMGLIILFFAIRLFLFI